MASKAGKRVVQAKMRGLRITITDQQKVLAISPARLRRLAKLVGQLEGQRLAAVDVAIVAADEMAGLNRRHLGHAGATDVLSFDMSEGAQPGLSAQLILCADVADRQGRLRGHGGQRELMLYLVHGLLHLMGYEDQTVRGAARMHAREDEILEQLGVGATFARHKVD